MSETKLEDKNGAHSEKIFAKFSLCLIAKIFEIFDI